MVRIRTQVAALTVGQVLQAIVLLLLILLLNKYYGAGAAGKYSLALSIVTPIFLFFDLNLRVVSATEHREPRSLFTYFLIRIVGVLLAALVALLSISFFYSELMIFGVILCLHKACESISNLLFGIWQKSQKSEAVGISLFGKNTILLVLLLVAISMETTNVYTLVIIPALVSTFWLLLVDGWILPKYVIGKNEFASHRPNFAEVSNLVSRSLPMGIDAGVSSLILNVGRIFIAHYMGVEVLGVYSLLFQIAFSTQIIVGAIGHATVSKLSYALAHDELENAAYMLKSLVCTTVAIALTLGGLVIIIVPSLLQILLDDRYGDVLLIALLCLASVLASLQRITSRVVQAAGDYFGYMLLDIAIFLVVVVVSFLLVRYVGPYGAALALSIGFLVGIVLTWVKIGYLMGNRFRIM